MASEGTSEAVMPNPSIERLRRKLDAPMPRNIEIKARIEGVEALARKAAAIADEGPIEKQYARQVATGAGRLNGERE